MQKVKNLVKDGPIREKLREHRKSKKYYPEIETSIKKKQ